MTTLPGPTPVSRGSVRGVPREAATIGTAVTIVGEVDSHADLVVEGSIAGPVWCEDGELVIAATGQVTGEIIARDVTIFGRVDGQIIATEVVDVRAGSTVTARVVSARFLLEPGAAFTGRVEPQHLDTAVRVARFQQQQRQKDAG
jgi:cytoskeletal protein CcmA (bactofilin family)